MAATGRPRATASMSARRHRDVDRCGDSRSPTRPRRPPTENGLTSRPLDVADAAPPLGLVSLAAPAPTAGGRARGQRNGRRTSPRQESFVRWGAPILTRRGLRPLPSSPANGGRTGVAGDAVIRTLLNFNERR